MTVITGIKTAVQIAARINTKYKYLDPTNKFIQKFVPPGHRDLAWKIKKYIDIGIGGGIIYDLLDIDWSALQTQQPKTGEFGKTRNRMDFAKSRRFKRRKNCYCKRRRT